MFAAEEKRGEEKRTAPPNPPAGGAGGGIPSDPETERVAAFAEERFPGCGYASLARSACGDFKPSWVREAVEIGSANTATSWRFMEKVLKRFKAAGRSDAEKTPTRAAPKPEPAGPVHPTHVAPANSPWRKVDAAKLRRERMGEET
jgi:hypothetical protein